MASDGFPRAWIAITITAVACGLASVAGAGAAETRRADVFTLAEIRGVAAQLHPNALLPTRVPPRIAFVDSGLGCSSLGVGGPPCFAALTYHTRRTGGARAFQLAIYDGRVASRVVRALLRHDGKFGTTTHFTAGRFAGTRERQWNKHYKVGGVDAYVWQYKTTTYALIVHFLNSGAQSFPGTVPRTIIASFSSVTGAKAPSLPPAPAELIMPDVRGMTEAAAIAAVHKTGLEVRRFGTVAAPTPEQVGLVVDTSPRPGESVPKDTLVTISIGV